MTKNHILIKSVALGVLLTLSPLAKAQSVDRALVTYFDKLYKSQSPKCTINEATKTRILSEIEPKCLVRTTLNNEPFISGVKSECSETSVKTTVDAQVDALCVNTAQKAEQATMLKAQQQAAAQKANGGGSGRSSGVATAAQNLQAAMPVIKLMSDINKNGQKKSPDKKTEEAATTTAAGKGATTKDTSAAPAGTATDAAAVIPSVAGGSTKPVELPRIITTTTYPVEGGGHVVTTTNPDNSVSFAKYDANGNQIGGDIKMPPNADMQAKVKELGGDPAKGSIEMEPAVGEAVKAAPKDIQPAAAQAANGSVATGVDQALEARHAKSKAEDEALTAQITAIQAKITAANGGIAPEATATCTESMGTIPECTAGTPQFAINCVQRTLNELKADQEELKKDKMSCSDSSAQAEKLCSMVRSEKAQQVQQLMSLGATVLSKVTAASEACGTTSTLSKIAQGGMLAAQAGCSGMKLRCDVSCASAEKTLTAMKAKIAKAIPECGASRLVSAQAAGKQVDAAFQEYQAVLEKQLTPESSVPAAVAQCKKHTLDVATMGAAALGFLSAFQDAQTCKQQLESGRTNGGGSATSGLAGPSMTTAEYCAQPQNAASITCKCTSNPNADGCMGSLAKSGVALGKINANGGASGFASAKQNGLSSVDPLGKTAGESSEPPPGAGLSEAAREALGIGTASPNGSPGVSGNFGSGGENSKAAKEEKEKPKFGFFSSLGSMLSGGRKPDQAAKAAIRNYEQDQAIKRKIASEQLRAQITTASGKSNFDKIRSRYRENASSFEQ